MIKPILYRQGDVLLTQVDEIPSCILIERTERGVVLAEGEVTGHAHRIASRHASLYRTETDAKYMRVMGPAPVALEHEEHSTVELPPGNYKITIHAEYQPGELPRQVAD